MKSFLAIILMGLTTIVMAKPTASEYGVILNLSGKQRMLTQKMSKESLLVALDCDKTGNIENLKKTSALFDKTLKGLRDGNADLKLVPTEAKNIIKALKKVEKLWLPFYKNINEIISASSANKEQVAVVADTNGKLLKYMNKCVKLYEKDASKGGDAGLASTINLSGKQRMLTQKMSKEFLLVAYGYNVEDYKLSLTETSDLFNITLKGLEVGDEVLGLPGTKDSAIIAQLKVVNGLWTGFKPIIDFGADSENKTISKDKIAEIAKSNMPLLKNMNKAVSMYANLAK